MSGCEVAALPPRRGLPQPRLRILDRCPTLPPGSPDASGVGVRAEARARRLGWAPWRASAPLTPAPRLQRPRPGRQALWLDLVAFGTGPHASERQSLVRETGARNLPLTAPGVHASTPACHLRLAAPLHEHQPPATWTMTCSRLTTSVNCSALQYGRALFSSAVDLAMRRRHCPSRVPCSRGVHCQWFYNSVEAVAVTCAPTSLYRCGVQVNNSTILAVYSLTCFQHRPTVARLLFRYERFRPRGPLRSAAALHLFNPLCVCHAS